MQDWERFGEEIRRTVQNAVDSQDYRKLNQTITDTINRAVNGAVNGVDQGMRSFGNAFDQATKNMGKGPGQGMPHGRYEQMGGSYRWNRAGRGGVPPFGTYGWNGPNGNTWNPNSRDFGQSAQQREQYGYESVQQPPVLYGSTTGAKVGGIIMTAVGGMMTFIFLIILLMFLVASVPENMGILWMLRVIFALITAGSGIVTAIGVRTLGRVGRFKNYSRRIGGREYCNISEISSNTGKSVKFVTKDLEKMITRGWFRQGHMDGDKKCLILSNRAYEEYLQIETRRREAKADEPVQKNEERTQKKENTKNEKLTPEVQKIIEQGDAFIKKIHECNEAIPGEEISAKISRMEMLVDRIFDRVEENPQSVSDIRKLMEYYLPTTVKLLEAYEQLDAQPVGGENIQTAKSEIEATIDTLNTAFEKLLDDLFQDTMWDVSSDISVLNTMLAQEGLKEDGMKK